MQKINSSVVIVIIVVLVVVVVGVFLYSSGKIKQPQEAEQQEGQGGAATQAQEVLSIAGKVTLVNIEENSFVLLQPKEERSFVVTLGDTTEFTRLIFPFDVNNPSVQTSFTPERQAVTIEDLQVNDQVFVRSSEAINIGQDIIHPLEVQLLP